MDDNKKRILEMLADKKINVDEAARLLEAIEAPMSGTSGRDDVTHESKSKPKYLRVSVQPNTNIETGADYQRVNIRVPMALIRAGIKLTSLMPSSATDQINEALRKKGVDVDLGKMKPEDLEPLVDALSDLEVDVQAQKENVRIYLE
ncbi:hypothetical protein ACFLWX_03135 [Chloroflexota bacterium]